MRFVALADHIPCMSTKVEQSRGHDMPESIVVHTVDVSYNQVMSEEEEEVFCKLQPGNKIHHL